MFESVFLHLSTKDVIALVAKAHERVLLLMPGITLEIASALINTSKKIGKHNVMIILDVDEKVARHGYGNFDAVTLLSENDIHVRVEQGLRNCVLIVDYIGYAFFSPPMLIEILDERAVGINAIKLLREQVEVISKELLLTDNNQQDNLSLPLIGSQTLTKDKLDTVSAALEANPPQQFDLARKVNVFNAFVEFVELRLIGLQIKRYTVQLPKGLVLALRDDATAKRLMTSFKLVSEESRVAKDAAMIEKKVKVLRELYTKSLGDSLGSVMLRSKRPALQKKVDALSEEIKCFQIKVVERLNNEIQQSQKKLVEGLWQSVKRAKPQELEAQIDGPITNDLVKRYVDRELSKVFPSADELVSEMRLELIVKGVTYDMLTNPNFQERVRKAYEFVDFDKPFAEFEAAPIAQTPPACYRG